MNQFSGLSDIRPRNDGRGVKFTIHGSEMDPVEIALDDTDLEDLTVQFLQLALVCAHKQGRRPVIQPSQRTYQPLQVDNFATAVSPHHGETLLMIPLGLFSLGFSVRSETLPAGLRAAS